MGGLCRLVAITGGIGSGKSVVCRILRTIGFPVYDCDTRARHIMDSSDDIKCVIATEICSNAVVGNSIDRKVLASAVFNNDDALLKLNSAVHHYVREDILNWYKNNGDNGIAFVETAILYQSGLDKLVNEVWEVYAPAELRIERVLVRNESMSRAQIEQRISVQDSYVPERAHESVHRVVNDDVCPLLPQIEELINN